MLRRQKTRPFAEYDPLRVHPIFVGLNEALVCQELECKFVIFTVFVEKKAPFLAGHKNRESANRAFVIVL